MPTLSEFYGIKIMMYWMDSGHHNRPHIHVKYGEYKASVDIKNGQLLAGKIPPGKLKLVRKWIDLRQNELMTNWKLASSGESVSSIEPLK
jgi:hypothetical protein